MWKVTTNLQRNKGRRALIETLEALGFYQYASPDHVPGIKQITLETGDLFPDFPPMSLSQIVTRKKGLYKIINPEPDGTKRAYFVDSEILFEQGMKVFLEEISPILLSIGVQINSLSEEASDQKGLSVTINGMIFQIDSKQELDADKPIWTRVTLRAFATVNALLAFAGSKERLYYRMNSGNDSQGIFLTEQMYRTIQESGVIPEVDIPAPTSDS